MAIDLVGKLASLMAPEMQGRMEQLNEYVAGINAHMAAMSVNTQAIAERLAAIDRSLIATQDALRIVIARQAEDRNAAGVTFAAVRSVRDTLIAVASQIPPVNPGPRKHGDSENVRPNGHDNDPA